MKFLVKIFFYKEGMDNRPREFMFSRVSRIDVKIDKNTRVENLKYWVLNMVNHIDRKRITSAGYYLESVNLFPFRETPIAFDTKIMDRTSESTYLVNSLRAGLTVEMTYFPNSKNPHFGTIFVKGERFENCICNSVTIFFKKNRDTFGDIRNKIAKTFGIPEKEMSGVFKLKDIQINCEQRINDEWYYKLNNETINFWPNK